MEKLKQTLVSVTKPSTQTQSVQQQNQLKNEVRQENKIEPKAVVMNEFSGRNLPEKKYRCGAVVATIWTNTSNKDGKQINYRTISLQRSYKDRNDEWQNTDSLRTADLPKAILVLQKAYEYIALNNDENDEDTQE